MDSEADTCGEIDVLEFGRQATCRAVIGCGNFAGAVQTRTAINQPQSLLYAVK